MLQLANLIGRHDLMYAQHMGHLLRLSIHPLSKFINNNSTRRHTLSHQEGLDLRIAILFAKVHLLRNNHLE